MHMRLLIIVGICSIQNAYSQCLGAAGPIGPGYGLGYGPGVAPVAAAAAGLASPYGYGGIGPSPFGLAPTAIELGAPGPYGLTSAAIELGAGYGGTGIGDVAVAGEMPVVGTTLVSGHVPILGAVRFAGDIPAAGIVSVAGSCGCSCGNPYYY